MDQICFLDCDGVLADFVGGCARRLGLDCSYFDSLPLPMPWDLSRLFGMSKEQVKEFEQGLDVEFWESLEPYSWAEELVDFLSEVFGDNVLICTSAGPFGDGVYFQNAVVGKEKWVLRHFPKFKKRTVVCYDKRFLASPRHILIDDSSKNCTNFQMYGGHAILFPRIYNGNYSSRSLDFVKEAVCKLYDRITTP